MSAGAETTVVGSIVRGALNGSLLSAEPVSGGYSGAGIWRVRARFAEGERDLVLKLAKPPTADDSDDQHRVYGTHPRSLPAVHALLRARGVPTYELIAAGHPTPELPLYWTAMSALGGEPIASLRQVQDQPGLFRALGEALATVHRVNRANDGTVDRTAPHATEWSDAFFGAFERSVRRHLDPLGRPDLASPLRALADQHRRGWINATRYVLSHVDGLQGHARLDRGAWRFVGHVDLEDMVFLDARFALAGFELSNAGGRAPPAFCEGYRAVGPPVDPSYPRVRGLFQLFLLVNWLWLEEERPRLLDRIAQLLQEAGEAHA